MSEQLGATVFLARAPEDNAPLAAALRARGAEVLELPCVRVEPATDPAALADAIRALGPDDVLVLTSRAGAAAALRVLREGEVRAPIAAVGRSTARQLTEGGLRPTFVANEPRAAVLARELPLPRGRILLARSDRALPELAAALRERGARVDEVVAYRTVPGALGDIEAVRVALRAGRVDVVVLASPSAVDGLCGAIAPDDVRRARIVAIGGTSGARVRERVGVESTIAEDPSAAGLLRAIERAIKEARHVAHV